MIKYHGQSNKEGKRLISCPSLSEKSGQELKTGKWRKEQKQKVEEQCSLAHRLLSLVSYTFQELLSPFYGPSTSIINHENTSQTYIQANILEAFSQLRVPLPSMSMFVSSWQNTSQQNDLLIFSQVICVVSFVILSLATYNFKFLIKSLICLVYLFFPLWLFYHIQRILVKSMIVRIPPCFLVLSFTWEFQVRLSL